MEEANNLEADARLPPRKRLLAGLKKHNGDGDGSSSPASPLTLISVDMSNRLRDLLTNNVSSEEIVDASRSAALAAAQAAAAARAAAEEKAATAAKAVAAAKSALELVAEFSVKKSRKERRVWDDKLKKHVPVQVLYKKKRKKETDEELARKLHRVINSSPRILKSSSGSDPKVHNNRKHKKKMNFETKANSNGGPSLEGKLSYTSDTNIEPNDAVGANDVVQLEDKDSECTRTEGSEMESLHTNGDAEAGHSTAQALEDSVRTSRKRGRIKQKKLPLSLCTVRDRENTKEEPKATGLKPATTVVPLETVEPSTEVAVAQEAAPTQQRKELTTPQCYGGSNILRSLCSNPAVTTGSAMVEVDQ